MDAQLWRGLALMRVLSLVWLTAQYAYINGDYAHPVRGWVVLAGMAVWTVVMVAVQREDRRWSLPWLLLDLAAGVAAVLLSGLADTPSVVAGRSTPLLWAAVPVLVLAVVHGVTTGLGAAVVLIAASAVEGGIQATVVSSAVLLLVAAIVIGWVAEVSRTADRDRAEAAELRARDAERRRLGRVVHDGVLQVLTQIAHRGPDLGPDGRLLATEAAQQEAALRALLASEGEPSSALAARRDLGAALSAFGGASVTVSVPATPILVEEPRAGETVAAVAAALDNVARHAAGAHAWVLLDDDGTDVRVTIRDDGPGFAAGRLEQAHAEGRMGVSQSIEGRLTDVGGSASVSSRPSEGVLVELYLPHQPGTPR